MMYVARRGFVDLPRYIFLTLWSKAKINSATALPYNLLLTHYLHSVGCMDSLEEEREAPIGLICRTTLSRFEAQIRRQQQLQGPTPREPQLKEEPPGHDAEE